MSSTFGRRNNINFKTVFTGCRIPPPRFAFGLSFPSSLMETLCGSLSNVYWMNDGKLRCWAAFLQYATVCFLTPFRYCWLSIHPQSRSLSLTWSSFYLHLMHFKSSKFMQKCNDKIEAFEPINICRIRGVLWTRLHTSATCYPGTLAAYFVYWCLEGNLTKLQRVL